MHLYDPTPAVSSPLSTRTSWLATGFEQRRWPRPAWAVGAGRDLRPGVSAEPPAARNVGMGGCAASVNATDARTIASRLGIDESLVRRLQARGYLRSLPCGEREVRERLLLAHCIYIAGAGAGARQAPRAES
jgi:hypothetical protein